MVADALELNASMVFAAIFMPAHTFQACCREWTETLVLDVLAWSRQSQVAAPVIELARAVNVVYKLSCACFHDESVEVCELEPAVYWHKADGITCA